MLWCVYFINQERNEISSKIFDYVNGYEERPLALYGNSGSGKTCVMAHTACILKENFSLQNACIVVRFVGTSHHSSCIRLLLRSVCQQVKVLFKFKYVNLSYVSETTFRLYKERHTCTIKILSVCLMLNMWSSPYPMTRF